MTINAIAAYFAGIRADEEQVAMSLNITANEALMSRTARTFLNSDLVDRYYSGGGDAHGVNDSLPFFTSRGLPGVAALVDAGMRAAADMLGASQVNLSCLSGVHAMMCAIMATTEPGETVMTVGLDHGGHFGTQTIVERSGRRIAETVYRFDTLTFDVERTAAAFAAAHAHALYLDVSFCLSPHPLRELRAAIGPSPTIIYDASHTLGLIMGGRFQDPFAEGADVICGNTHKTLPGPHKGMIAFREPELAARASGIIDNALYSSPHGMSMVALATTLLEMRDYGRDYASQIIANSNALGAALDARGASVRIAATGRYSENHQVHLMLDTLGSGADLVRRLAISNIVANLNNTLGGRLYLRIGAQEVTRRGMREPEMEQVAALIIDSLDGHDRSDEVAALVSRYPHVHYSYDQLAE
jgi:fluorothreonine transaldolase